MEHSVSLESLERFARGSASQEENRQIVAHLLQGCAACGRELARHLPAGRSEAPLPGAGVSERRRLPYSLLPTPAFSMGFLGF